MYTWSYLSVHSFQIRSAHLRFRTTHFIVPRFTKKCRAAFGCKTLHGYTNTLLRIVRIRRPTVVKLKSEFILLHYNNIVPWALKFCFATTDVQAVQSVIIIITLYFWTLESDNIFKTETFAIRTLSERDIMTTGCGKGKSFLINNSLYYVF